MSIEKKIECIRENSESAILALTSYLDSIYNMTDQFFDNQIQEVNGEQKVVRVLKPELAPDKKAEKFAEELNNDAGKFEIIRGKLKNGDFNLTLTEIARIGLAFVFVGITLDKQIKATTAARDDIQKITEILMAEETQTVDFSKE